MSSASEAEADHANMRVIKRYANRKLYDTESSSYVTLHEIAAFVRGGEDVQIIDNNSKEDITNVTLAQIIYEEEKKGGSEPRRGHSLKHFIQEGRQRLLTSFRDSPMSKLVNRSDESEGEVEAATAEGEDAQKSGLFGVSSPREAWDELQRIADSRMRTLLSGALGHVQQLQSEIMRLRSRIEELEARLAERSASGGRSSKRDSESMSNEG